MSNRTLEQKKFFAFIKHIKEHDHPLTQATAYYQDLYNRFGVGKWFLSWNWSAFLWEMVGLPFVWFFYRRMYFNGLIISLLQTLSMHAIIWTSAYMGWDFFFVRIGVRLLNMVASLALGVFANALYFHFIKSRMTDPQAKVPPGGTNWMVGFIIGAIFLIYLNMLLHNPDLMPAELRGFVGR